MMECEEYYRIALVGDSDIDRWPQQLAPVIISGNTASADSGDSKLNNVASAATTIIGQNGATLRQVIPLVEQVLSDQDWFLMLKEKRENPHRHCPSPVLLLFLVVCAGENDIGQGLSLDDSVQALHELIRVITRHDNTKINNINSSSSEQYNNSGSCSSISSKVHLIFLGPKLEPWLQYDKGVRRDYIRMSQRFQKVFRTEQKKQQERQLQEQQQMPEQPYCTFVDCLTVFCGDSAKVPGALFGGNAVPVAEYFDYDQLHLSQKGYQIWKRVVEDCIETARQQMKKATSRIDKNIGA